jgi:hypothetical protein
MIPLDRDPRTPLRPTMVLEADPRPRVVDVRRQGDADGSTTMVAATAGERSTSASDSGE